MQMLRFWLVSSRHGRMVDCFSEDLYARLGLLSTVSSRSVAIFPPLFNLRICSLCVECEGENTPGKSWAGKKRVVRCYPLELGTSILGSMSALVEQESRSVAWSKIQSPIRAARMNTEKAIPQLQGERQGRQRMGVGPVTRRDNTRVEQQLLSKEFRCVPKKPTNSSSIKTNKTNRRGIQEMESKV